MHIITLISDWGLKDHYISAVKGVIYKLLPDVNVVDISHEISRFNFDEAGFVLKNAFPNFPDGTVHIIGVNEIASKDNPHLAIKYHNQFFIGADNGIFPKIFDKKPEIIIEIQKYSDTNYFTFPTRDIFAKCAVHLSLGKPIEELGIKLSKMENWLFIHPQNTEDSINGTVIYVDKFENLVTNISSELFRKVAKGRKPYISLNSYDFSEIHKSYSDVGVADPVALFGSHGFLEIALFNANASSLLGITVGNTIRIEFE
ncbi:MAG: SAM-dependent chlorinase/fluorinase [Bacteroidota bacterium]